MTGRRIALLVALLLFTLAGGAVQAADLGARAMGMGGAYTALANDATAVYWNPAGLAEVSLVSLTPVVALETSGYEAFTDFVELLKFDPDKGIPEMPTENWDISVSSTGLAGIATKRFGLSYLPSAKASIGYEYIAGDLGSGEESELSGNAVVYNDKVITAAIPLARAPFNLAKLNIGANFKFIDGRHYEITKQLWDPNQGGGGDSAVISGATGRGFGLDLGAQAQVTERLRLGFVARDVVRNVTWTGSMDEDGKDLVESRPTIQAGVAFKAPLGLTLAADVENTRENGKDVTRLRAGGELSAFGLLAVRGGVRTNPDGAKPTYSLGLGAGIFKFLRLEGAIASDLEDRLEFCLTGVAQF